MKALDFLKKRWFWICFLMLCFVLLLKNPVFIELRIGTQKTKPSKQMMPVPSTKQVWTENSSSNEPQTTALSSIDFLKDWNKTAPKTEWSEITEEAASSFIARFHQLALSEMKKYKIPASVILAQGLLHSHAGKSELSLKANNYFNLTCLSQSTSQFVLGGVCYEQFENAWASFRNHSLLLHELLLKEKMEAKDYKTWTNTIQRELYPNNPEIEAKLKALIIKYNLQGFDTMP